MPNLYNNFRKSGDLKKVYPQYTNNSARGITKEWDEPTYLSFKLNFTAADIDNKVDVTDFDRIPQPLFGTKVEDDLYARNFYSTQQYLRDMNEMVRFQMMEDFILKWNQLQNNFQWYFQSIEGIADLLKASPLRGRRVGEDVRITINSLEGLDQRISHLLNLYKKIAWDDTYQRWVLPDIMRYFRLTIYVTEFRTFHRSAFNLAAVSNEDAMDQYGNKLNQSAMEAKKSEMIQSGVFPISIPPPPPSLSPQKGSSLFLQRVLNLTPTYVLDLERCEFDIESLEILPGTISNMDPEMRQVSFSIKVGNFKERYINPVLNTFLYDTILNGYGRTASNDETIFIGGSTKKSELIGTEMDARTDSLMDDTHVSGTPFSEFANSNKMSGYANNNYVSIQDIVDPVDPATWTGNALTLGKAYLENLVETQIDKASMQNIPGLGISFNEALDAIQSKNVFSLLGAARRALSETIKDTLPSQELEGDLADQEFYSLLENISKSQATNPQEAELINAANLALNDNGVLQQIKDYSKATNLISDALGEINDPVKISGDNTFFNNAESGIDGGFASGTGIIFEGTPSSTATSSKLSSTEKMSSSSEDTITTGGNFEQLESSPLGSTDGNLGEGSQIAPSSELGSSIQSSEQSAVPSENIGGNIGESLGQPEDGIGTDAGTSLASVKPSENLEGKLSESALIQNTEIKSDIGGSIPMPDPGEAVDGDPIDSGTIPSPDPGKATENNKI